MQTTETPPIRLAILNDYPLVVAGLVQLLAPYSRRAVIVEAASNAELTSDLDLVLFDSFASTASSPADLTELCARHAVVVYAWNLAPLAVAEARRVGAVAIFSKAMTADDLVEGLEGLAAAPDFVVLSGEAQPSSPMPLLAASHGLTPRELEVLALIARGLSNHEITEALFVSLNSVKTYIRTSYRKIGVERRSQAVIWALDHDLRPVSSHQDTAPPGARTPR